jgi:thiamine biosynthesis lipoprotein
MACAVCSRPSQLPYVDDELTRRAQPWLGTIVDVTVPATAAAAIPEAFAAVSRVHRLMSFHDDSGDLARLRRARPGDWVRLDPWTIEVLAEAKRLFALSEGVFDVACAARLVRWGFLPKPEGVDLRAYRTGTAGDLDIGEDGEHVRQKRPLLIDLGGIAKGYAVDRAVEALRAAGVGAGLVNAGGDLCAFGALAAPVHLRAPDWRGFVGLVHVRDVALASSSNLHMRRRRNGCAMAPHVGRAGAPALSDKLISVFAPTAMIADALTKVALADQTLFDRIAPSFDARLIRSEGLDLEARP